MTKEDPELKPATGVRRVPNSTQWHYFKKTPKELAEHPAHKGQQWAFRASLLTADLREANLRAAAKLVELEAQWAIALRQVNPLPVSDLTPETVTQLADYIRFCVFNADDYRRNSPQVAHRVATMRDLAAGKVTKEEALEAIQEPVGEYLDDHSADGLEGWNLERDTQAGKAVARRIHAAILKDAIGAAEWLGVSYDWTKPEARPYLLKLLEAKREALEDLTQRDKGKVVATPSEPVQVPSRPDESPTEARKPGEPLDVLKAAPSAVLLRDVFDDWAKHGKAGRKPYPTKTIAKYSRALYWYEKHTRNPSMADMERTCGVELLRTLVEVECSKGMTTTSVRDHIINLGTLLNHYSAVTGKLPASLWARITTKLDTVPASTRDEWTEEELQRLFGLPVWQHYELPKSRNAGLDAAYWVPLLGLFTGARITELAQLRVDDLEEVDDVWYLRIEETAEGQSLKARASKRTIPLAVGLIDLGLVEYREAIRDMGQEWLFPGINKDAQNNAGGGISSWFSKVKIRHGFRKDVVFHSLRGSLNTALARTGTDVSLRCKYIGQKPEGGVNVDHYLKLKPWDLIPLAESIAYPSLKLPKVYKAPAWRPGWKA
ncbi:site-specific integrase [Aquabacterium sp.]|uniref:site-specific integrase n=1 Tax=Aquabacterium sp. TaxID=1872578 RepID=UPI00199038D1|nr:site-specific integrase [Aquabacterium sp.]MBC7699347.1 site-specific integrase [Aquabacterium sp.]